MLQHMEGDVWFNGELLPAKDAKIHILTHSLHYSGAAFEGERAYNGKVFKLEEHTERLLASAQTLQMKPNFSIQDIIFAHKLIMERNNVADGYIRPLIFRGAESMNMTNDILSVNMMIAATKSVPKVATDAHLHISKWRKAHPNSMPPQCKSSGHYTMMIIAQQEAKNSGYSDAILLDWRGYVAECTTTNIFFVKDECLVTPIADAFLNGITRQTIIELAHKLGLTVKEKHIELHEIMKYDECFMTGTSAEIKRVQSIDMSEAFDGKKKIFEDNRISNLLTTEYSELVRR